MMEFIKPYKYFYFALILITVFYLIGIFNAVNRRPESVHVWAMCDRASIARNYAEDSMNFFFQEFMNQKN